MIKFKEIREKKGYVQNQQGIKSSWLVKKRHKNQSTFEMVSVKDYLPMPF